MVMALAPAALAILLWGLSFVATKAALEQMSPMAVVTARTGLAVLFLWIVSLRRRASMRPPSGIIWRLLLAGFLGVFLHQTIQAWGLTLTTAVRTGWFIGIIPLWSALLALLFLGERLARLQVVGLFVGFLGATLLLTGGSADTLGLPSTRGDLLILLSTVNWAVCTVMGRSILARMGALESTTIMFTVGFLLLVPVTPWNELAQVAQLDPAPLAAVAFLGIGCSGIAYLCWFSSLARAGTASVSALLYLQPLVTLAGGMWWLGEQVDATTLLGGATVMLGVYLVQRYG